MRPACLLLAVVAAIAAPLPAGAEILWVTEGNRLHRIDLDDPDVREVLVEAAERPERGRPSVHRGSGRDVNGMICHLPTAPVDSSSARTPVSPTRRPGGESSPPTAGSSRS